MDARLRVDVERHCFGCGFFCFFFFFWMLDDDIKYPIRSLNEVGKSCMSFRNLDSIYFS